MTLPMDLPPHDAARRIADGSAFLLDVREPDEFALAHVAEAVLIPLGEITARVAEIPDDRDVIVMCRSGRRSGEAQRSLMERGYRRIANLDGGIIAWEKAGLPIRSGDGR